MVVDDADKRYNQFLAAGVVLRNRSRLQGCKNTLRVTVGTPEENTNFIEICKIIDQWKKYFLSTVTALWP